MASSIPTIRWAATVVASQTGRCSNTWLTHWYTGQATNMSPPSAVRTPPSAADSRTGPPPASPHRLCAAALATYDQIIGLQLADTTADGCITKAPCGGDKAGPSPVDRRKGGLKRSVATDGAGVPLGIVSAGANRPDSPLLGPTLQAATDQVGPHWPDKVTIHLDAGYDSNITRSPLDGLGLHGQIARKGVPAPVQVGKRWVVERTHSWMNGFGKLRRCTDRNGQIVDFFLYFAAAFVTVRALIREARTRYRWPTRPTTRRLK